MPRAAVDCGTNSTRVLVVDDDGTRLVREMTITRLGHGVDETGHLDDEALARTLETLERYRGIWESHGVRDDVRIAATSAVRDAADRDRFFDGVRRVTGAEARVLSGEDEAETAFRGATSALDVRHPVVLVDVGGGSTELVVGDDDGDVVGSVSLQLGCVRLTERLLRGDPPAHAEVVAARREIAERLDEAVSLLAQQGARIRDGDSLVGVAGTVTTLAALHLGLDTYEPDAIHGAVVPRSVVASQAGLLATMPARVRRELGPMAPGREDVILGGALIVEALLHRFGFAAIVASEADILDGLVAGTPLRSDPPSPLTEGSV